MCDVMRGCISFNRGGRERSDVPLSLSSAYVRGGCIYGANDKLPGVFALLTRPTDHVVCAARFRLIHHRARARCLGQKHTHFSLPNCGDKVC